VLDEAAAREAARKAVADLVDEQAMDAVLAQIKGDGLRLTGPGGFLSELVKAVLERGLQAELSEHLGYGRHEAVGRGSGNSRKGSTPKTVQTEVGPTASCTTWPWGGCTVRWTGRSRDAGTSTTGQGSTPPWPRRPPTSWPWCAVPAPRGCCSTQAGT